MTNNKTSGSYDSYMSKDVSQLLVKLNNANNPEANKWQKNFYHSIIKLHDNGVEKIVDFYSIFKKNGIIKKEVINFMNKVVEKFITEKKFLKFTTRNRANTNLINGFLCSFCIDHPEEMLEMMLDFIMSSSENHHKDKKRIQKAIKSKIDNVKKQVSSNALNSPSINVFDHTQSAEKGMNSVFANDYYFDDDYFENEEINNEIFEEIDDAYSFF